MDIGIREIEYVLPAHVVTNDDLHEENPSWDMQRVEKRAGVRTRHIAGNDETALDLAYRACQELFKRHAGLREKIDGLIVCTQSPDYIMPPNACILHKTLGLRDEVFAFDFNLACSGYIYGLFMAVGLIKSRMAAHVCLVNADTYSRFIHPRDRSTRVLFGDGAAVTWISSENATNRILDIRCATHGRDYEKFIIPAGGCRLPKSEDTARPEEDQSGNVRTKETIHMDGLGVLAFINAKVPKQIHALLEANGLTIDEIDRIVFHQASKLTLDSLVRIMSLPEEKVYRNLERIGNTVSASIPIALRDALDSSMIVRGHKVLLSGFGVGLSYGSALIAF